MANQTTYKGVPSPKQCADTERMLRRLVEDPAVGAAWLRPGEPAALWQTIQVLERLRDSRIDHRTLQSAPRDGT